MPFLFWFMIILCDLPSVPPFHRVGRWVKGIPSRFAMKRVPTKGEGIIYELYCVIFPLQPAFDIRPCNLQKRNKERQHFLKLQSIKCYPLLHLHFTEDVAQKKKNQHKASFFLMSVSPGPPISLHLALKKKKGTLRMWRPHLWIIDNLMRLPSAPPFSLCPVLESNKQTKKKREHRQKLFYELIDLNVYLGAICITIGLAQ